MKSVMTPLPLTRDDELAAIAADINGGAYVLCIAPPTNQTDLSGSTPSANFNPAGQTTGTISTSNSGPVAQISDSQVTNFVKSSSVVGETIVGVLVKNPGGQARMYIAFDKPLVIANGPQPLQVSFYFSAQLGPNNNAFKDNSVASMIQPA